MDLKKNEEASVNSTTIHEENNKNEEKKIFCHIDKEMIRFKIHFFLFFGAMGAMLTYSPLIAKDGIGISATSYSTVLTFSLFSTILTKNILGYVADYFKKMKLMLNVLIIMHCIIYLFILTIPPIEESKRNAGNGTIPYYFKDYDQEAKFLLILVNKNNYCDMSEEIPTYINYSTTAFVDELIELEHSLERTVCSISHVNQVVSCFQPNSNTTKEMINLKTQNTFCCLKFGQLSRAVKKLESNVQTTELEMSSANLSKGSHQCKVKFSGKLKEFTTQKSVDDFETYQFWLYAALMFLTGTCSSSVFTLSDSICYESVHKYKRDFGRQRIYSVISWGLLAPLGGLLCDLTNGFHATWLLMTSLQCLTVWNLYKMEMVIPQFSQNIIKDVITILKSPTFLTFQLGVFINGVMSGIVWFYLIWFVSSLGANNFLCGMIPYMQCFAGELPVMFYSGWIIEKLGHFNISTLSLLSYAVRLLCYSYLQNPWLVLPVEITQGFTYGLFYPAVASFGKLSDKPGIEATTQSILFSTHEGLGAGIGCVLAGIGFDNFGGHWTFFYFSMFAFGATLLNICCTLLVGKNFFVSSSNSYPPKE